MHDRNQFRSCAGVPVYFYLLARVRCGTKSGCVPLLTCEFNNKEGLPTPLPAIAVYGFPLICCRPPLHASAASAGVVASGLLNLAKPAANVAFTSPGYGIAILEQDRDMPERDESPLARGER